MVSRAEASTEIVKLVPAVAVSLRLAALFDLEAADLTANQVLTLMLVNSAPDGRMKAGEVASRLEISLPAATALVDRLVVAGVIERTQGTDRRVVWVSVTEAGQNLLARLRVGLESRIHSSIEGMDPSSLESLIDALRRVASFADQISEAEPNRADSPGPTPSSRGVLPP
jgi:DNA-binding MarR family transcriptional regulator